MKKKTDTLQGSLDLLVLQSLQQGPMHGWGITLHIERVLDAILRVEEGSLYPALHRMEKQGWIAAEWKLSENKQRAKFYRLTPAGRKHLVNEQSRWDEFVKAVGGVMKPAEEQS